MNSLTARCLTGLACLWLVAVVPARGEDRTPDAILAELHALKPPPLTASDRSNPTAIQKYLAKSREVAEKRAQLIHELYQADPDHKEIIVLIGERWATLARSGNIDKLTAEIDEVSGRTKDEHLKTTASYWKARAFIQQDRGGTEPGLKAVDLFLERAPKADPRGAMLLLQAALQSSGHTETQVKLLKRVSTEFPGSQPARLADGELKKMEAIGKPFALEFTDAISGSEVSVKALKGKVVVIDFWATWCGPCVAEMPKMKGLYAKYKDKGVEFIGVSLDQPKDKGGLDKLKAYVKKNDIQWPQYYQGNFWQSEFSSSWGINSIPTMFLVDAEGKLASIHARGQLDNLIPDLLKKASAKGGSAGGGN